MKNIAKMSLFVVSALLGTNTVTAEAASSSLSNDKLQQELSALTAKTAALDSEVKELKSKLNKQKSVQQVKTTNKKLTQSVPLSSKAAEQPQAISSHYSFPPATRTLFDHPITVILSPDLGLRPQYSPSDLLEQYTTINEDLLLLRQRADFYNIMAENNVDVERPILVMSGGLEAQAIHSNGFGGAAGSINLSTAELDFNAIINSWVNGLISVDYDDSPASTGSRVPNSRLYLNRGFFTIGNLNQFPVYLTMGQMYLPFGRYSSLMLTTPMTESMGRINQRTALLGFAHKGFYAQAYAFTGAQTTGSTSMLKQGGGNVGFGHDLDLHFVSSSHIDAGVGVVSNIADSQGMQNNGIPGATGTFAGFGVPASTTGAGPSNYNALQFNVPAIDAHSELAVGPFSFLAEYMSALRRFAVTDLSFGPTLATLTGALPSVLHTEIDYSFNVYNRPVAIGAVYEQTWQALALNLPNRTIAGVISTSIWRDTVAAIEYRHDINYPSGNSANGGNAGVPVLAPTTSLGGSRNTVTLQLGAYF